MNSNNNPQSIASAREYAASHELEIVRCVKDTVTDWATRKVRDYEDNSVKMLMSDFESDGMKVLAFHVDVFEDDVNRLVRRKIKTLPALSSRGIEARVESVSIISHNIFTKYNGENLKMEGLSDYHVYISVSLPVSVPLISTIEQ